jgi:lambda repressor-like predicted transcriptional regulator
MHDIDRNELVALRAQGLSMAEVAGPVGCSTATLQRVLVRWDMPHSRAAKHIIDPEQLADLRADGLTMATIAASFGCSASTVIRASVRAGISRGSVLTEA